MIGSWQLDPGKPDAIYGEALARTWAWLSSIAAEGHVNMGIEAPVGASATVSQLLKTKDGEFLDTLRIEAKRGPVVLPAHVDALVQTSPQPEPEPSIALFLHGPDDRVPDVQVLWRGDLNSGNSEHWAEIVEICPPVSGRIDAAANCNVKTLVNYCPLREGTDTNESRSRWPRRN